MPKANLEQVLRLPKGFQEIQDLVDALDHILLVGIGHMSPKDSQVFGSLIPPFTGTALKSRVESLVASLRENLLQDRDYETIALARSALQLVQYEVLQKHVREALGRTHDDATTPSEVGVVSSPNSGLLEAVRKWLIEMSIAGFDGLTWELMAPFEPSLQKILSISELNDINALLLGFYNEILNRLPIKNREAIPSHRWADLWTRLVLRTMQPRPVFEGLTISGELFLVSTEIHQHANFVLVMFHGILSTVSGDRAVRITQSSFKVDAIDIEKIWLLFPSLKNLVNALASSRSLKLKDAVLFSSGELVLSSTTSPECGKSFEIKEKLMQYYGLEADVTTFTPINLHPFHRHPLHIAEPVFLSSIKLGKERDQPRIEVDGATLPLLLSDNAPELGLKTLRQAEWLLGFMRYDNGWYFQPVSAYGHADKLVERLIFAGSGSMDVYDTPPKSNTVEILKERASRLLRSKG